MTSPFIGEIQIFGFNYAPVSWALCNGATLPISQNSTLFALIGTIYGGDGRTNFQLPNLAARTAFSQGTAPGLTPRTIGDTCGENEVTLLTAEMPYHNHGAVNIYRQPNTTLQSNTPGNNYGLMGPANTLPFVANAPTANTTFAPQTIGIAGGNQPHENRQPFLALIFCIALEGVFPSFG